MTTVEDLVQWLRAQLDEDERIARAAPMEIGGTGPEDGALADLPARWMPDYHLVMREPLAEGEAIRIVTDCAAYGGCPAAVHIAAWDPARVLREIDAKRRTLDEHAIRDGRCRVCAAHAHGNWTRFRAPCTTLRLLALPYADRPGFREEWRP